MHPGFLVDRIDYLHFLFGKLDELIDDPGLPLSTTVLEIKRHIERLYIPLSSASSSQYSHFSELRRYLSVHPKREKFGQE